MKTTTTKETGKRAQEQSEEGFKAQPAGQLAQYLVTLWQAREQAVSFPFEAQHAAVLRYIRQECGEVEALSAGLFCAHGDAVWHGGVANPATKRNTALPTLAALATLAIFTKKLAGLR